MKGLKLNPEKQKEYDEILQEMKSELDKIPQSDGKSFCCAENKLYKEIEKKYLPQLRKIMED